VERVIQGVVRSCPNHKIYININIYIYLFWGVRGPIIIYAFKQYPLEDIHH
jgi:hypothetical protein